MTLRQLRYLCEIVRRGLHLSKAAEALHTSQPGVSKQIQLLEEDLGVIIFNRKRNRMLSLTPAGQKIYRFAERALLETMNIREVGNEVNGRLVIATSHTQARYVLPGAIRQFVKRFPSIRLEFSQGHRQEIFQRVEIGEADLAIGTYDGVCSDSLVLLRYGELDRSIVARLDHPLLQGGAPTLAEVAQYPLITHAFELDGGWKLRPAFEREGLTPNIVFRAADADVCKAYVELGIGIAILSNVACADCARMKLGTVPADHLFEPEPLYIGIRRNRFHRRYVYHFIETFAPSLDRATLMEALEA